MTIPVAQTTQRVVPHRLHQLELTGARAEDGRLGEHLIVFGGRLGAPGDPAPGAVDGLPRGRVDHGRADRHVEPRSHRCVRGPDQTDGTAVDAPRLGFDGADDLHRAGFGCARDRTAGEQRPEQLHQAGAGPEPSRDVGGQLEHRLVALDGEERRHVDTAGLGDAGDVVAHEVDDHDVLGALLGAGTEAAGQAPILVPVTTTSRRALHGAEQHARRRGARRTAPGWRWPRRTDRDRGRRCAPRAGRAPGPGTARRDPPPRARPSARSGCTGRCLRRRCAPGCGRPVSMC